MKTIAALILTLALVATTGASTTPEKAAKPLTTDGLAITLLRLAERAEGQEMRVEAQAIRRAAAEVLKGTPPNNVR